MKIPTLYTLTLILSVLSFSAIGSPPCGISLKFPQGDNLVPMSEADYSISYHSVEDFTEVHFNLPYSHQGKELGYLKLVKEIESEVVLTFDLDSYSNDDEEYLYFFNGANSELKYFKAYAVYWSHEDCEGESVPSVGVSYLIPINVTK